MPLPSSGQIKFSQISTIVFNRSNAQTAFSNTDVRTLLGVSSGQISISAAYSKPIPQNYSYTTPGDYSLVVPAYENIGIDVRGGGQGGNGGSGSDTCWCGQFCFFCCNGRGGDAGGAGGASYFRVGSIDVTADGATSSVTGGGYGGSVTTGGGGAGGTAGTAFGCTGGGGSVGRAGGRVTNSFRKGSNGPNYSASCSIRVGGGGAGGFNGGGAGGSGAVFVSTT